MSITKERKQELIEAFKIHEHDTGSPEVQIAILTERIRNLSQHFLLSVLSRYGYLKHTYSTVHHPLTIPARA